jgi:hypothetical protein
MPINGSPNTIAIRELSAITTFAGDFPHVANYAGVNVELLTEGDAKPFFITMAIAEVGRTSENGLLYDKELVDALAGQLQGSGGIQGHIPTGEESTAFPIDVVDWVGHEYKDGVLWAKAYVPPGQTREYVRRLMARNGKLGTSIYGYGVREYVDEAETVWRSLQFELHSVDLAQAKMAALDMGGNFHITAETTNSDKKESESEAHMPNEATLTLADVPEGIREQIIRQAQLETNAERVSELAQQVETLTSRVAELDAIVDEREARINELETAVSNRETTLAQYREVEFSATLDERIAEATNWQITDAAKREKLAALRVRLRRDTLAELGAGERNAETIEAALQAAFDDNQLIIETMRDSLAGPTAGVGGLNHHQPPVGTWESYKDNPGDLNDRWGTSLPKKK